MSTQLRAVVCPIFNESAAWRDVCLTLSDMFDLVVVVDDGSKIAAGNHERENVVVLRHDVNQGKGRALETGFRYCLDRGVDFVATIDGDGEHDPINFLEAFDQCRDTGMVSLSRAPFFGEYNAFRRSRNAIISARLSKTLGVSIQDTQSGMRIFSAAALRAVLNAGLSQGYAVETTVLYRLCLAGFTVKEVPMIAPGVCREGKKYANVGAAFSDFSLFLSVLATGRPPRMGNRISQWHGMSRPLPNRARARVQK